jgi:hypothetical protein
MLTSISEGEALEGLLMVILLTAAPDMMAALNWASRTRERGRGRGRWPVVGLQVVGGGLEQEVVTLAWIKISAKYSSRIP